VALTGFNIGSLLAASVKQSAANAASANANNGTHSASTTPHNASTKQLKHGASADNLPALVHSESLRSTFKTKIVGDIFGSSGGDSIDGFMYRSRVMGKSQPQQKATKKEEVVENNLTESIVSSVEVNQSDSDSGDDFKQFKTMNPKQQLALTIKNWTLSETNDQHIISEGGVQALIALCHVEDASIRKCCAHSFFNLSSRENNREQLLKSGATNGVVLCLHGSPPRCAWKVAKLCALTLCNLSMFPEGESTMADENAVGALVQLSTYRGPALLPICVQALYNMTSVAEHFSGIARIIKAFLNISSTGYEHSVFLIRALVNCSRYPWLRGRVIEDGALTSVHAVIAGLSSAEQKRSLSMDILTAVKALSDSSGCRVDMISKGAIDILHTMLPHADERGMMLIIKIMHNLMQVSTAMNKVMFEHAVLIVTEIVPLTKSEKTLQYCAACLHLFTKEDIRGMKHLALNIIDSMSVLLHCKDPLTQFFAISSSGNLFFNNLWYVLNSHFYNGWFRDLFTYLFV
jgi:hypothetical protein